MSEENENHEEEVKKPTKLDYAIAKRLLEERKVFLWGAVEDKIAEKITSELFYLDLVDPGKEIKFYINTPGGSITAGMVIYDTMQMIKSPITVIVTGMAASMGSILLCGAKKGRRLLFPHATVLIHQPLIMGRIVAPALDINIHALEMEKQRELMNDILSKASGQPIERVRKDSDRDFYMNAQESIDYGLADKIINSL